MKNNRRGFTLVELLIVIATVGILAAGAIFVIDPVTQFQKARDAQRKSDLSQIQKAFETFYQDYGKYPDTLNYKIKKIDEAISIEWGNSWLPYMNVLPKDPSSSKNYVYYSTSSGQTYYLYASLERGANDSQVCQGLNANGECSSVPGADLCAGKCNYGVSSPNVSP